MRIIKIKDQWNAKDSKLVVNNRITELGLTNYWSAVDASVEFNITCREAYVAKIQAHQNNNTNQAASSHKSNFPKSDAHDDKEFLDPMRGFFRRHSYQRDFHAECRRDA